MDLLVKIRQFFQSLIAPAPAGEGQPTLKEYLKSREFWATIGILSSVFIALFIAFFQIFLPVYTNHNETVEVPDVTSNHLNKKFINYDEAVLQLEEAGLYPVLLDSQYYPELPPQVVVNQEPIGLSLVKPGRKIYLRISRKSPPSVTVPNIVDGSLEQARYLLESWKLKEGVKTIVPGEGDPGWVLRAFYNGKELNLRDTVPDRVPEGARIDLHVSKGLGQGRVALPKLVGMPLEEAMNVLSSLGLSGKVKAYLEKYEPSDEGVVAKQYPSPATNDSIRIGFPVELTVFGKDPTKFDESGGGKDKEPKPIKDNKTP